MRNWFYIFGLCILGCHCPIDNPAADINSTIIHGIVTKAQEDGEYVRLSILCDDNSFTHKTFFACLDQFYIGEYNTIFLSHNGETVEDVWLGEYTDLY